MKKYILLFLLSSSIIDISYAKDPEQPSNLGEYLNSNIQKQPSSRTSSLLQNLERRVAKGDVEALFELGLFYFKGVEIERDVTKAIHYLKLAAEKEHAKALYNLSTLYLDGSIVEQDIEKGLDYLERAVHKSYIPAQVGYAFLYLDGAIVGKDIEEAYKYLTIASHNPDITSEELREIEEYKRNVAQKLTKEQVETIEKAIKNKIQIKNYKQPQS